MTRSRTWTGLQCLKLKARRERVVRRLVARHLNRLFLRLCGYHFSVTSGTILYDTHLPLTKFAAVHLIRESGKETSASRLKRTPGVAYIKVMVLGAIECGGRIRLKVERCADRETLHAFVKQRAAPEAECVMTDELPAYGGIADENAGHKTAGHSKDEWVGGGSPSQPGNSRPGGQGLRTAFMPAAIAPMTSTRFSPTYRQRPTGTPTRCAAKR